jgi:phenylpropionate dioxygenase-like ring-hydroxylating dioxygenase large terminal subunit
MLSLRAEDVDQTCRPMEEATMLPRAAFTDPGVLEWEREALFLGGWICAGHADQVRERGQYLKVEIGDESIFVVADDDGVPHAFHNTCRHRGARVVDQPEGRVPRLQCPYHAWSYRFDGSLANAPHTDGVLDFDPACFGLHRVRCAVVEGLVLLDPSGEAPPAEEHAGDLAGLLARYRTGELTRTTRLTYEVDANWKVIAENYSECLHCPGVHPELNRLSHYLSGETLTGEGAWCGGTMVLSEGAATMAQEGGDGHGRTPIAGLDEQELRSVAYLLLFPNTLVSLHPDYVMLHTLWPRAVDRTEVVCEWFFEPRAVTAEGFDDADAVGFWDQVNREDWRVCELTQRGMRSRAFTPGRYTDEEGDVHAFDVMVAGRYLDALRDGAPVAS